MRAFGYDIPEDFLSEISGERAVDIHHITARGKGSSKELDRIENLMALTRKEHEDYGDIRAFKSYLYRIHQRQLELNGIDYDSNWINKQIQKYEIYEND